MDTHASKNAPCYCCGLENSNAAFSLSSPFQLEPFNFSTEAYKAAHRVIKEGEAKLAELEKAMDRLRVGSAQIRLVIEQHRKFAAPIHRVPNEILVQIFEEASWKMEPDSWSDLNAEDRSTCGYSAACPLPATRAPWELSVVCRRWRQITLSTSCSHLWRFVRLDPPIWAVLNGCLTSLSIPIAQHLSLSELQAQTARSHPLHMRFGSMRDEIITPVMWTVMQRFIVFYLPNCVSLDLGMKVPATHHLDLIPPNMPQLASIESLAIQDTSWLEADHFLTLDFPNLYLGQIDISPLSSRWFHRLTYLSIQDCSLPTAADLLAVLRAIPCTQDFTILRLHLRENDQGIEETSLVVGDQAIYLPALRRARLSFLDHHAIHSRSLAFILRHIFAPSITTLILEHIERIENLRAVRRILSEPGLPSKSVSLALMHPGSDLDTEYNAPGGLFALLSDMPALERLELCDNEDVGWYIDEILMTLYWPRDSGADSIINTSTDNEHNRSLYATRMCPKLTHISIEGMTMDSGIFRKMLESRVPAFQGENSSTELAFLQRIDLSHANLTDVHEDDDEEMYMDERSDRWADADQMHWLLEMGRERRVEIGEKSGFSYSLVSEGRWE